MIYTKMTKRALKLCFQAHKDQTDKNGMPYVFHPFHLAEQMANEREVTVALLHDVIEDTPYTLDNLIDMGFDQNVVDAIELMTHDAGIPYMEYIATIKTNAIARKVKLADLRHNSDLTRFDSVDEGARARVEKYARAIELLET